MAGFLRSLGTSLEGLIGRQYRQACGHRQYGLLYHDLLVETPIVREAVRRLPDDVREQRFRRMKIANQLTIQQTSLPKEQWTTEEEDVPYLEPYILEVQEEWKDRHAFWL